MPHVLQVSAFLLISFVISTISHTWAHIPIIAYQFFRFNISHKMDILLRTNKLFTEVSGIVVNFQCIFRLQYIFMSHGLLLVLRQWLCCCCIIVDCCSHSVWNLRIHSLFCYAVLCVLSSFALISAKRELVILLSLSSLFYVTVIVLCVYLIVPGLVCSVWL